MTKKASEAINKMAPQEIREKIVEMRGILSKELASKSAGTKPENPGKIRKNRRSIARCLTILSEKERRAKQK